jgi:LemA protein
MNIATLVILAVLAFWMLGAYKRLKRLRSKTHHSYSPLASHLRQRHAVALALAEAARPLLSGDLQPVAAQLIDAARQAGRATDEAQARGMRGNALQVVGSAEESLGTLLDTLVGELQDLTSGLGPEPAITELLRQRDALQEQILHVFPTTLVALAWRFKEAPLLSGHTALRLKGQPSAPMPLL